MEFVTGRKTREEFESELNAMIKLADTGFTKLNELVAPQMVDFNLDDYYKHTKKLRFIDNDNIEKVTMSYLKLREDDHFNLNKVVSTHAEEEKIFKYVLRNKATGKEKPATFRSDIALDQDSIEFLAAGHPLVENALNFFLRYDSKKNIINVPANGNLIKGYYFIFLSKYVNGLDRSDLLSCLIPFSGNKKAFIPEELLIPPGFRHDDISTDFNAFDCANINFEILNDTFVQARSIVFNEAEKRATELKEKLHSIFKKEEYKLEISYGKKIRQLDEKRDRQKLRYRMTPSVENRAVLSRTENELKRAKDEMELSLEKIRRESKIEVNLRLLQIYRVV
jgi:hypothetical protein